MSYSTSTLKLSSNSFEFEGSGALQATVGTTSQQAWKNSLLVEDFLKTPRISELFKSYEVPDHGVFTIDKAYGRSFAGNKLAQIRKVKKSKVQ